MSSLTNLTPKEIERLHKQRGAWSLADIQIRKIEATTKESFYDDKDIISEDHSFRNVSSRELFALRLGLFCSFLAVVALAVALGVVITNNNHSIQNYQTDIIELEEILAHNNITVSINLRRANSLTATVNPPPLSWLAPLTSHEVASVKTWMEAQAKFELTPFETATSKDNFIWRVQRLVLDQSTAVFAEVDVYHEQKLVKYRVGPLPITANTLADIFQAGNC